MHPHCGSNNAYNVVTGAHGSTTATPTFHTTLFPNPSAINPLNRNTTLHDEINNIREKFIPRAKTADCNSHWKCEADYKKLEKDTKNKIGVFEQTIKDLKRVKFGKSAEMIEKLKEDLRKEKEKSAGLEKNMLKHQKGNKACLAWTKKNKALKKEVKFCRREYSKLNRTFDSIYEYMGAKNDSTDADDCSGALKAINQLKKQLNYCKMRFSQAVRRKED
jgi:hypothetical protein